jgi:hypothetical protein
MYPDIGEEFAVPDADIVEVDDTLVPSVGADEYLVESLPALVDGKWARQFEVRQMTPEEIAERDRVVELMNPKPPAKEVSP